MNIIDDENTEFSKIMKYLRECSISACDTNNIDNKKILHKTIFLYPETEKIYNFLYYIYLYSQHVTTCSKCYDLIDWMEDNMTEQPVKKLFEYPDILEKIKGQIILESATCKSKKRIDEGIFLLTQLNYL